ncbi:hypothetical protein LJC33_00285 [Eubacteriales bacterium OttesenSCG-928-N13]|nr:hypothetical protein [Eubacteriales bacterium OttesenSCG-928-N13]
MCEMTDGELAVRYAVENELRKVLAVSKEAGSLDELIKHIEQRLEG